MIDVANPGGVSKRVATVAASPKGTRTRQPPRSQRLTSFRKESIVTKRVSFGELQKTGSQSEPKTLSHNSAVSQDYRKHEEREYIGYSLRTDQYRYIEWRDFGTGQIVDQELYDHNESEMETVNLIRNYLNCKSQHASDITFGDVFQHAGYATGIFGKWKQTRGTRGVPGKDYIFQFGWDEFCCFDVTTEG